MALPEREAWLRRCDAEHETPRRHSPLVAAGDAEWALASLRPFGFWEQRDMSQRIATLSRVLAMRGAEGPTRARARVLYSAAVLADIRCDWNTAMALSQEAAAIYRQFGDTKGLASTMTALGLQAQRQGRYAEATSVFGEAVSLWQQLATVTAVDLARSIWLIAAKAEGNLALAYNAVLPGPQHPPPQHVVGPSA